MPIKECLLFLLAKAYQKVHHDTREKLKSYGLTPAQSLVILFIVEEGKEKSAREVAKELKLDNATLSGILDRLESGGWIKRALSEEDKRLVLIFPTDKINDIKEEIDVQRQKTEDKMFKKFTTEEKLLFKRMLRDFS